MTDQLVNLTKNTTLANRVEIAGTWLTRLKGLLGRDRLPEGHCLVITPCRSVHTHFMKFNLDILFIDASGRIVYLAENLPPFRITPNVRQARFVVELPAGIVSSTGTSTDDCLNILPAMLKK
ncbi:DUF192 domain-containing protein [Phosphitispora fastidiosa]|uniref:DUF192 domain-containing protein n=1 Tax=Phosphitispora fastidiosa TaxID=2837202 RepID=UPI001E2EFD31|nr:DUF192 domain-containing protein [Phosphitispora fastidiosa]MBU7008234.1 uncharacterized membrane protein (UPF0127 family) [Phosphitispora fastidiosa]